MEISLFIKALQHKCLKVRLLIIHLYITLLKNKTIFYKTITNHTSGEIKLTEPMDGSIILLVLTLSITQITRGWI